MQHDMHGNLCTHKCERVRTRTHTSIRSSCARTWQLSFNEPNVFNDSEDGEQWRVWRKAMAACFSTDNIKASMPSTRSAVTPVTFIPGQHQALIQQLQRLMP